MKSFLLAGLLLGATSAIVEEDIISHEFKHFKVHFTPKSKAEALINGRQSKKHLSKSLNKNSDLKAGEVSGYKVEFFQYISVNDESYSENITQFGTWYFDESNNNTRTEVVTYSLFNSGNGDRYYETPSEYLEIDGTEYQILEADSQYVYCQTDTPEPSEDIEYEKLGYAFVIPPEDAFSIVWGPRLVRVEYDPTTNDETVAYYGYDAFNDEPVMFAQYNTTFSQTFIWSKIREEDLNSNDFNIPTDLTCSSLTNDGSNGKLWHDEAAINVLKNAVW